MSIGFKEWALVCDALGRGEQNVILRKGGIAEGRDGFYFRHDVFYLLPTLFHEQLERTTLPADTPLPQLPADSIRIDLLARLEWTELVGDLEKARALAPFHVLRPEVVEERFRYDEPAGIHVACVRIFRLEKAWTFPMQRSYGGCRSWVTLPEPPAGQAMHPVLDDAAHTARMQAIRQLLEA